MEGALLGIPSIAVSLRRTGSFALLVLGTGHRALRRRARGRS